MAASRGNAGFMKVAAFPSKWDMSKMTRYLCDVDAGQEYTVKFTWDGTYRQRNMTISPSSNNATSNAVFEFTLTGKDYQLKTRSRPGSARFPVQRLEPGSYSLTVVPSKDAQIVVTLK